MILHSIVYGIGAYLFALIVTRSLGRKIISQMTFFDFVIGISMGNLVANLAMGPVNPVPAIITALTTLALMAYLASVIHLKSFRGRKTLTSEPVVLIDSGTIIEKNMKRVRFTLNDLTMNLRLKNIFNISDVEYAIIETDGQLSVLRKAEKLPLTPFHMNIPTTSSGLMRDVIIDGIIMEENLDGVGLDKAWLVNKLNSKAFNGKMKSFMPDLIQTKIYIFQ